MSMMLFANGIRAMFAVPIVYADARDSPLIAAPAYCLIIFRDDDVSRHDGVFARETLPVLPLF